VHQAAKQLLFLDACACLYQCTDRHMHQECNAMPMQGVSTDRSETQPFHMEQHRVVFQLLKFLYLYLYYFVTKRVHYVTSFLLTYTLLYTPFFKNRCSICEIGNISTVQF